MNPQKTNSNSLSSNFFSFGENSNELNRSEKKLLKKKKTEKAKIEEKQNLTKIKKHLQGYFR